MEDEEDACDQRFITSCHHPSPMLPFEFVPLEGACEQPLARSRGTISATCLALHLDPHRSTTHISPPHSSHLLPHTLPSHAPPHACLPPPPVCVLYSIQRILTCLCRASMASAPASACLAVHLGSRAAAKGRPNRA